MTDRSPRWFLGFDFYGAGNVGDDLMLAGFLECLQGLPVRPELLAATPWNLDAQRRRFPAIRWMPPEEFARLARAPGGGDAWLGVGDTPFQHSVGPWFLSWLRERRELIGVFPRRRLVGVGCEGELGEGEAGFREVASWFERIGARDQHSLRILRDRLGVDPARLILGADLAHVALAPLTTSSRAREGREIGLIPVADRGASDLPEVIARFAGASPDRVRVVCMETREAPGCERTIALCARERMPDPGCLPVIAPDYDAPSTCALIEPVRGCDVLLSWRYHGLLAGAWLGCRLGAIARSSKVAALARELALPVRTPPVSADDLASLAEEAVPVPRARLEALRERAIEGALACLAGVAYDPPPREARPTTARVAPDPVRGISPVGPRLASLGELRSASFQALMRRLNAFARPLGLREFTTWSKAWEYPWLWFHSLASVEWEGARLLDIGAERSPMPWLLATLGARVTLVETDAACVAIWERVRDALGVDVEWHVASDETLPLGSASFDVVTSLSVIEHQPDKRRAIDEVARVLRPGGVFALSFDICEPDMGMTFPEWNGRALTMEECEREILHHPALTPPEPPPPWNLDDIAEFLAWHRTTAPHHNYVTGAAVLRRR